MATTVDERVVQLTLDNKQFNSASSDTINSIEKLKKTLEFEGAIDSFDQIEKGIKNVDFAPMTKGVDEVGRQFTWLDSVVDATLRNLTNRMIDFGERTIKSLSTDQIMSGWNKYAEQTGAVQTIMAATAQQFDDTAVQMEEVNSQLEKLTWFTDETSHKFNDMVGGIGKFTANNIDLETSVKAMEGIATWASLSGANTNEASRAIYNLAQAISVGTVKLIDWRSIENANMGTTEFKQTVIETAEEMGTLIKVADGLWKTLDGKGEVSISNFSENLSKGWFTSGVLLKSLDQYGRFADQLNQFVDETGILTATAMNFIDDYVDGTLNMSEAMQATGLGAEDLTAWLEKLGSAENDLGRRAFRAAQETKTFQEAIDYVKEAVSSGWSTSFKYIFGDYLEAKEWWSEIAETMYDVFVIGGEIRNSILEIWKEGGGRDDFLDGIRQGLLSITKILDIFKEAWDEVWYGDDDKKQLKNKANVLLDLTKGFKELMEALMPTETTFNNIKDILKGLFTILRTGVNVVKAFGKGLSPIVSVANTLLGTIVQITADLSRTLTQGLNSFFTESRLQSITNWLNVVANILSGVLQIGLVAIFDILNKVGDALGKLWKKFQDNGGGIRGVIKTLIETVNDFWQSFVAGETIANGVVNTILYIFGGLVAAIKAMIDTIIGLVTGELTFSDLFSGKGGVNDAVTGFGDILDKLKLQEKFQKIVGWIKDFVNELADADGVITQFVYNITNAVAYLYDKLKGLLDQITIKDIKDFLLIAILWQFVSGINKLNLSFKGAVDAFKGPLVTFNNILKELTGQSPLLDKLNAMFTKTSFLQIGIAATLLVAALGKLNTLDYEKTQQSVASLGVTLAMLLAAFKVFSKILASMPKREKAFEMDAVIDSLGKNLLFISAGALMISQALKILNETLFTEAGSFDFLKFIDLLGSVSAILAALVLATKSLANIEIGNTAGSIASIIGLATGLRLIIGSIALLAAFDDPDKLIIAVGSAAAIILSLGQAVKLMRKIDWKSALSMVPLMISFGTALVTLTGAIGILSTLAASNNLADALEVFAREVIGLTAALAILGRVLKDVKASTIASIGLALTEFGLAFIAVAGAMKMLEGYDWAGSGESIKALAGIFVVMVGALALLGVVISEASLKPDRITAIGSAMLKFGAAVTVMAAGFRLLQGIDWNTISSAVHHMELMITIFAALTVGMAALSIAFTPAATLALGEAMNALGSGFLKFGLAITAVSAGIFLLAAASGVMATIIAAFQALATKFGVDLPAMVSAGFDTLELIIREFLEMVRNLAPDFLATFISLFGLIATAIFAVKHPTGMAIAGVIMEILNVIESHGESIINTMVAVVNMIVGATKLWAALNTLAFTIGSFIASALVMAICGALSGLVNSVGSCIMKWVGDPFNASAEEIAEHVNQVLSDRLLALDNEKVEARGREAAYNSVRAMIEEYDAGQRDLDDALVESARQSMAKYEATVGTGAYDAAYKLQEQLNKGIDDQQKNIEDAGKKVGEYQQEGYNKQNDPITDMDWWKFAQYLLPDQMRQGIIDNADKINSVGEAIAFLQQEGYLNAMSGFNFFTGFGGSESADPSQSKYYNKAAGRNKMTTPYDDLYAEEKKKELEKQAKEAGEASGNAYTNGLTDAINSGSGKASKAAKDQAKTIAEAFSEEIDKISRDEQIADKLYKLWNAQNPTATDMQKSAKEIEYQTAKVNYQVQKANISQKIYQQTLEEMGESAKETHEAYISMLDDQIELLELQNKLAEMQKTTASNSQEAWQRYTDLIYAKNENGESVTDWMLNAGFTIDEIKKAYASQAGYILPEMAAETADAMMTTASNTATATVDTMANSIVTASEAATPMIENAGAGMINSFNNGAIGQADTITNSLTNVITTSADGVKPTVEAKGGELGATVDNSTGKGIDENVDVPKTASENMCEATYEAAKTYLQVNDEYSQKFWDVGKYIAQGMAKGISENQSVITEAAVAAAKAAYAAAMRALNAHSPSRLMWDVGMYYDQGLALGIKDNARVIEKSATDMINRLTESTTNSLDRSSVQGYLQQMFGLDDDSLHLTVVVDADTSSADSSMSELERAYAVGMGSVSASDDNSTNNAANIIEMNETMVSALDLMAQEEVYRSTQLEDIFEEIKTLSEAFKALNANRLAEAAESGYAGEKTNIAFTQNNYSPKAISRVETYRNTQRQFTTFANKFGIAKR